MPRANAIRRVVVDYGADPADRRSIGLAHDLWSRVQGAFTRPTVGADDDRGATFTGDGPEIQVFSLAASYGGGVPYRSGDYPTIDSGVVVEPADPVRRIFADRLRRRSGV